MIRVLFPSFFFLLFYCDVLRVHEKICRAYVRIKRAFLTEIDCAAVARARKKEQDEENIPPAREWQGGVTQLHYHAERICHVDVSKSWRVEIFHAPKWEMPHPGNFARFRNWLAHVSRIVEMNVLQSFAIILQSWISRSHFFERNSLYYFLSYTRAFSTFYKKEAFLKFDMLPRNST